MKRALPHDITNTLAAAALVLESGLAGRGRTCSAPSARSPALPHRLELVADRNGIAVVQRLEGDDPARGARPRSARSTGSS